MCVPRLEMRKRFKCSEIFEVPTKWIRNETPQTHQPKNCQNRTEQNDVKKLYIYIYMCIYI